MVFSRGSDIYVEIYMIPDLLLPTILLRKFGWERAAKAEIG